MLLLKELCLLSIVVHFKLAVLLIISRLPARKFCIPKKKKFFFFFNSFSLISNDIFYRYWYGSNYTDPGSNAIRVNDTSIGQFQSVTRKFTLNPDITFNDFSVLNLYSTDEEAVYAQAVLRPSPKNPSDTKTEPDPNSDNGNKSQSNRLLFDLFMMTKIIIGILVTLLSFIWTT